MPTIREVYNDNQDSQAAAARLQEQGLWRDVYRSEYPEQAPITAPSTQRGPTTIYGGGQTPQEWEQLVTRRRAEGYEPVGGPGEGFRVIGGGGDISGEFAGVESTGRISESTSLAMTGGTRVGGTQYAPAPQPKSQTTTTRTTFEGEAPAYEGPTFDTGQIKSIAARLAAPGIRRARLALSQALNQYYENPAARGLVVRKALEGYGIAVETARAGAYQSAASIYGQQYQARSQEAIRKYSAAMDKYRSTAVQTATTAYDYTAGADSAESYRARQGRIARLQEQGLIL